MTVQAVLPSTSSAVVGSVEPRLWTPPLRELTRDTSWGFDFNDFCADVLEEPNDPWQAWLSVHVGELLPDGRPRFRNALILVARQQGKTKWARKLTLYWMFVEQAPLVLGTSTNRNYAKESWMRVCDMAVGNPLLAAELPSNPVRATVGEEALSNVHGSRYMFAASNRRAGRSLTVHRGILDEIREHADFSAWGAVSNATNAVRDAQIIAISNQGDVTAVVLDALRDPALEYMETGLGDYRLGLFEWSAPDGSNPTDLAALAQANPDLGNRTDPDVLVAAGLRAVAAGGEELAMFKTEVMCMRVKLLDPAIDPEKWHECLDRGGLETVRSRVALCLDVSLDGQHAALYAAAVLADGRVRVDAVSAWAGPGCMKQLRRDLPGLVLKVKPLVLGWFPSGPAAAVAADMAERPGVWPPPGVTVEEIRGEVTAVCMGFREQIVSTQIAHSDDPLLNAHVAGAEKLYYGDGWRFTRRGTGHCDAVYAAAGAVHLARTLPVDLGPFVIR